MALTKKRTVLERTGVIGDAEAPGIEFSDRDLDDPSDEGSRSFHMDEEEWLDMGEPDTITLSIEKGDKLNRRKKPVKKSPAKKAAAKKKFVPFGSKAAEEKKAAAKKATKKPAKKAGKKGRTGRAGY